MTNPATTGGNTGAAAGNTWSSQLSPHNVSSSSMAGPTSPSSSSQQQSTSYYSYHQPAGNQTGPYILQGTSVTGTSTGTATGNASTLFLIFVVWLVF
jgi:hypothetical protein